ncbi:MAG: coproporphyrinogen III oxidase, partial [Clostridia bacterium]|nr:coproporphyrinogen III oxidase [Clostridia bacterium]
FDNISLDLIYALPGQSQDDLQSDIKQALALKPEHISLYGLTLPPNSPWGRQFKAGELALPDDEQSAALQELIFSKLKRAGYEHYEIANFALDDTKKSRHNCAYWHREDYLGAGAGAAGALGAYRYTNKGDVSAYLEALRQGQLPPVEDERLSAEQVRAEALILALRLAEGADLFALSVRYNFDFLSAYGATLRELVAIGLLDECEGLFALTDKGILLANEVFVRLI